MENWWESDPVADGEPLKASGGNWWENDPVVENLMPDTLSAPSYATDGEDPFQRFLDRGTVASGVNAMQSGALMGFDDELAGAGAAYDASGGLLNMAKRAVSGDDIITPEMSAAYERGQRTADYGRMARERNHPVANIAGEIAGGITTAGGLASKGVTLAGRTAGKGLLPKIGAGAVEGAAYGGAIGAGHADSGERLTGAANGALIGAATGGLIEGSIGAAGAGVRAYRNRGAAASQVVDEASKRTADAAEMGIDLSRGQATRDFAAETFESDAITGGRGQAAQRILQRQRDKQTGQVNAALDKVQDGLANSTVDDPFDAAMNVQSAVRSRSQALKREAGELYDRVGKSGTQVDVKAVDDLAPRIWQAMDDADGVLGNVVVDHMPVAKTLYAKLGNLKQRVPDGAVSLDVAGIEKLRQSFSKAKGSGADESRVIGSMKREFDGWFEDTVDKALMSGDPSVLDDLKKARTSYAQYMSIKKSPTQIVRKMADESADSVEIANWLLGSAKLGGRQNNAAVVREIKDLIGDDSQAMNDLRRAAFHQARDERPHWREQTAIKSWLAILLNC